jgi:hypothetical protein
LSSISLSFTRQKPLQQEAAVDESPFAGVGLSAQPERN